MAGYKRKRKVVSLKFEGDEYEGLEVRMKPASLGAIFQLQTLVENMDSNAKSVRQMMKIFCDHLKSWNLLDDDDKPVPTTVRGLESQDLPFVMELIRAWTKSAAGVSAPLSAGSPSGETSQEASLQLASLSQNLEN